MNREEAPDSTPRELVVLSPAECRTRLGSRPVGRIVFVDARGPVALPVNHVVDGDSIVFRTSAWSSVLASKYAGEVGFEVDDFDDDERAGWSVLVSGRVSQVVDDAELHRLEGLGVTPWAEGERTSYLRLQIHTITGRRLVPDEAPPPA
jgi:nitroimidazol reductase NimA-like FMN-containing flavoprotein (pyridoxamine 5'-phosphate oxidase superfamily)